MKYNVIIAPKAEEDLKRLLTNEPKAFRKPSPSLVNFMSIHEREQVNPSHLLVTVRANGAVESARGTDWSTKFKILKSLCLFSLPTGIMVTNSV
jgi:hypothetical protein